MSRLVELGHDKVGLVSNQSLNSKEFRSKKLEISSSRDIITNEE